MAKRSAAMLDNDACDMPARCLGMAPRSLTVAPRIEKLTAERVVDRDAALLCPLTTASPFPARIPGYTVTMTERKKRNIFREEKPRTAVIRDRGFWGIGTYHPKKEYNFGTMLRNAYAFGASFVFTIGPRFKLQAADTARAWRHVPVFRYEDIDDLKAHLPYSASLVGVELADSAIELPRFAHPERACYLLGAEDEGLPPEVAGQCDHLVRIPGAAYCLNLASAGTIVMYDRIAKRADRG